MSLTRSSTLPLAALALILGAGVASAQTMTVGTSPVSLSYAKGSSTPASTTTAISASADGTAYTAVSPIGWLSSTPGTGMANTISTGADTLTLAVVTSVADHMAAGSYSAVVPIVGGSVSASVTVNLTITASASPLSTSAVSLTYVLGGPANQSAGRVVATIADNDTAADTYTVTTGYPTWLTVTPATGQASLSTSDHCTFAVVQSVASGLSAGPVSYSVHLAVAGQPDLVVVVTLTVAAAQPLATTTTALDFAYTIGGTVPASQPATITVASGSVNFNVDPSTVPAWLTATATGSATTSGAAVTFAPVGAVIKGLAAGNYNGSVGYEAAGATSELLIPVALTVSNGTATVSINGAATNSAILNYPGAATPTPVVTVVANNPIAFSATCTVVTTNPAYTGTTPCTMSGASAAAATVTGIAYTFGTPLTIAFDSALFASPGTSSGTPFGTTVTVSVTVTAGSQSPVTQSYAYSIQPIAPTFTALSPTSAAQIATGNSLVVTLTGTNFVGPNSILSTSSLSPTKVFVAAVDVTTDAVVINSTTMLVSVPQGNFPSYATGKTTANMVLGVANQTGSLAPTVATATQTLVVTNAPVVYAVTSTATYLEPSPGNKPSVAPYELISIFGANFGTFSAPGYVTGTLSAFNQFGDTVNISGAGTTVSPFVTLSVTFKIGSTSYKSPILFANATQINCIVPSGMSTAGQIASVTVASGANSSDGLFTVTVATSQPGIFTLSSDGVGQGAILNPGYVVNGSTHPASSGNVVSIYMTGLGAPIGGAVDNSSTTGGYSAACVEINGTTAAPGYIQQVNTSTPHSTPPYTAPTTAWTNIDGAVIESQFLLGSALPPCFVNSGSTAITVTFGTTAVTGTGIGYAGFVDGSVAGLYQVNATVPGSLGVNSALPVTVTIGSQTSPAGVTIAVH
jgi:uncharacterized protein (TIGR03437 family)